MPERKSVAALRREAEKRNESLEGGVFWRALDFLISLFLVLLIVFSVRGVLIDPVRVDGKSMLDTLQENEVMLVDRAAYAFASPSRGDVVLCYYPDEYYVDTNKDFASRVKRVIAVGGETVELRGGKVYIDGVALDEPYVSEENIDYSAVGTWTVSENCVFVLGDNRRVSIDSHYFSVGEIPVERVVGKVRFVIFRFENARRIGS